MIEAVYSAGIHGMEAYLVKVECDISEGFPSFDLVGMLSSEVREAKERTVTALKNCGINIPSKKITINLAPANIKKHGTGYDLAIAGSIAQALGIIPSESTENVLICGELMLDGKVSGIRGVLPIVKLARDSGIRTCIIPGDNACEGAVIDDVSIISVSSIKDLILYLRGELEIEPERITSFEEHVGQNVDKNDFSKIAGQSLAKRGLEIGAAGLHNVIMAGPPGTGKSMLAKCLPGILPPMNKEEALEISAVYSVSGLMSKNQRLIVNRPVVEVHHSATETALAGGGHIPRPGLISLAHRGVLFLDEMPEFSKSVLEVLRQPIEDRVIHISKNGYSVTYPSDFMLVGALNPCPCGMYPDMKKCTCTDAMRKKYISKISKPLLDRIDICLRVLRPKSSEMINEINEESSENVRKRVVMAQEIQRERYKGKNIFFNSQMGIEEIEKYCDLGAKEKALMEKAISKYDLSARAYHRVLRCARTIADLDGGGEINDRHLTEALFFKSDILE